MNNKMTQHNINSALMTDLYQLTMAYGFWKNNLHNQNAVFHLFFRHNPFKGGYTIASGIEEAVKFITSFKFTNSDIEYLATLKGNDSKPIFEKEFLNYLYNLKLECDVDAVAEGTIVFPHEPILRVKGPIVQCQLIESALLAIINFHSLISTKSARICRAAKGDPVMEFGLRRAQGFDGALSATRAAFIGGAMGTSNVFAAKELGIPALGTHSHCWIQAFDNEVEAFETFSESLPGNTILLVDTYNSKTGIEHAIQVAKKMKAKGVEIFGIRLDSGDLAYFSQLARKRFNEEGVGFMKIIATNDLDEHLITSLKLQEAAIDIWGVGTKLVTAFDQPALGGVYKLSAIEVEKGEWDDRIKLSEQTIKINIPGFLQVRRFLKNGIAKFDMIYDIRDKILNNSVSLIDPTDLLKQKNINLNEYQYIDLLNPIIKNGKFIGKSETIYEVQQRVKDEMQQIDRTHLRLTNPHIYHVGLEEKLYNRRMNLIIENKNRYK